MKKILLPALSILLLCPAISNAQSENTTDKSIGLHMPTEKGNFLIGSNMLLGEVSFGSASDYDMPDSYDFSFSPRAGYFIANNLLVGGTAGVNFSAFSYENRFYSTSTSLDLGIFARKYFGKMTEKNGDLKRLRFFIEAGANYRPGWFSYDPGGQEPEEKGTFSSTSVYLMPGVNYFINKNVAFEAGLNMSRIVESDLIYGNRNTVRFNVGLQFFFGGRR